MHLAQFDKLNNNLTKKKKQKVLRRMHKRVLRNNTEEMENC
jgi:hypothetical protein